MDMNVLDKVDHELWNVLAAFADGIKSADDVETVKHAISGIFKIRCLKEMEDFKHSGYGGGNSYRYYDDRSFARGGRSMAGPQFYRDGGNLREKLEHIMQDTTDERQRQVIREMMNRL